MSSRIYYAENEDSSKEESINKYEKVFEEYLSKCPTLTEALDQMFISSGATQDKSKELIKDIFSQINEHLTDKQLLEIKKTYPEIDLETSQIISSYTCEISESSFNIYRILNNNLVSENRNKGIKKISKYLFILLKSLRKLKRFYPPDGELYRCISVKVNLYSDPFNDKVIPYIKGNTKTFWGFTSTSENISMTYNFLGSKKEIKSGTIFTLYGDIWGYDITLFNVFGEKEILLEPERKIHIINSYPPINEIIQVRCEIKETPLILGNIIGKDENQQKDINDSLESQKTINEEPNNNTIIETSKSVFDKIFFFFEPEVNSNSKIFCCFCCSCCCCFSCSMKTVIKFNLISLLIYMTLKIFNIFFGFSKNLNYTIEEFTSNLLNLLSYIFLYISYRNHISKYARFSLFIQEFFFIKYILNIKRTIILFITNSYKDLKICKSNDIDDHAECFGAILGLSFSAILFILSPFDSWYEIYIAYFQLSLTKMKRNKKLE